MTAPQSVANAEDLAEQFVRTASDRIRVVTAASLFDGHDASINIIRRMLQAQGAEVIHLGHDRSAEEIADAAIQEDAHAAAVSSYQGGHVEYFKFLVDRLREKGGEHIRVYGGGGGTILPSEIIELQDYGVSQVFSPEDGRRLGLQGMAEVIISSCVRPSIESLRKELDQLSPTNARAVARVISLVERLEDHDPPALEALQRDLRVVGSGQPPLIGLTGTGGAGKSSVLDELVRRFRIDLPELFIGILLVDPTRRRSQGALLGDRIRLNAIHDPHVYVRSLATRRAHSSLSGALHGGIGVLRAAGFELVLVETAGIGQSDSGIVDLVDIPIYVMTPEYGAASQLEKIDMLDFAELVILNKADRPGAQDALRDIRKQWRRNRQKHSLSDSETPVVATIASQWNDPGLNDAYRRVRDLMASASSPCFRTNAATEQVGASFPPLLSPGRVRYLSEIADAVRKYRAETNRMAAKAADANAIDRALRAINCDDADPALEEQLRKHYERSLDDLDPDLREQLVEWPNTVARYSSDHQQYTVRGKDIAVVNHVKTLSASKVPKVALPSTSEWGYLTRYLRQENLPGRFPFTAGVFPFRRETEDPVRMFAGEGNPERTNRRFHYLAKGQSAVRLSTAFDSVTLYGRDPDMRPDIYGKVGNSGVSVCTVDDAKKLYSGFNLCDPSTSVSMTINGPAPTILAFFLNAAIDQQIERHLKETVTLDSIRARYASKYLPSYSAELPNGHNSFGLGLLGIAGDQVVDRETYDKIKAHVLSTVRGTVQADILKEDQAQNTCIFGTEFSLKVMGDIQEYFIRNRVRNFYSVSISGYHIAEAGANPITQLAFTLANGFTYVEHYLERGMSIDNFAPNLSFFFSNGLDAEYSVIGRVARRIWAIAMRDRYGASQRSQFLKYHIQTSGRSLHAQEISFNDIRTTLQALLALQDNANSLHTNAYDEAVTTPSEESVRRALAIQLIVGREFGLMKNGNPLQGSYIIEYLTDLVEEAVLDEFDRLSTRGGVLGAMETGYQRGKIQEESLHYESLKHSGELPIVGVNTFENHDVAAASARPSVIARSTAEEKEGQIRHLQRFQEAHKETAPNALAKLRSVAKNGGNVFEELMETVKYASLGQITQALFDVGGQYRRSM